MSVITVYLDETTAARLHMEYVKSRPNLPSPAATEQGDDKEPPHIRLLRRAWDKAQVPTNGGVVFSAELKEPTIEYPARFLRKAGLRAANQRRGEMQGKGFKAADIERAAKRYLKAAKNETDMETADAIAQALRDTERRVWLEAAEIAEYYSLPKRALSDSAYKSGGMNTRAGIAAALRARAGKERESDASPCRNAARR